MLISINVESCFSIVDRDESSLDLSFKRNNMSADELRRELRKRDIEYEFLMKTIEKKEREFLDKERELRMEASASLSAVRETERRDFKEQELWLKTYHEKKVRVLSYYRLGMLNASLFVSDGKLETDT